MTDIIRRVLYIEDEPEMIDLVRLILGNHGFEVVGADGGREGVAMATEIPPDLILLDLMMPDVDGWEVYRQLKATEATRQIPVVIITARSQRIDKVFGLQVAKVDAYLTKPFAPQELLSCLTELLGNRSLEAE
jgi:two-component system, OmpR family, response regulator VicR